MEVRMIRKSKSTFEVKEDRKNYLSVEEKDGQEIFVGELGTYLYLGKGVLASHFSVCPAIIFINF